MNYLVSIIMPARNAGRFIQASIDSVLSQTHSNIELIIINDKSTDDTLAIIEGNSDNRIIVIDGPGKGISAAFNLGLSVSKGHYICRCDADDLFPQDRIFKQVTWLTDNPDFIAVCGKFSTIDSKGEHLVQFHRDSSSISLDEEFKQAITRTHFGTFMILTAILIKIGGCRTFFETAEDLDLQLRISEQGSIYFLNINFYQYRLHNLSITHTQANNRKAFFEQYARNCHLQRVQFGHDDIEKGLIPEVPDSVLAAVSSDTHIINHLISESWYWHKKGDKKQAVKSAKRALKLAPLAFMTWKNIIMIMIKR